MNQLNAALIDINTPTPIKSGKEVNNLKSTPQVVQLTLSSQEECEQFQIYSFNSKILQLINQKLLDLEASSQFMPYIYMSVLSILISMNLILYNEYYQNVSFCQCFYLTLFFQWLINYAIMRYEQIHQLQFDNYDEVFSVAIQLATVIYIMLIISFQQNPLIYYFIFYLTILIIKTQLSVDQLQIALTSKMMIISLILIFGINSISQTCELFLVVAVFLANLLFKNAQKKLNTSNESLYNTINLVSTILIITVPILFSFVKSGKLSANQVFLIFIMSLIMQVIFLCFIKVSKLLTYQNILAYYALIPLFYFSYFAIFGAQNNYFELIGILGLTIGVFLNIKYQIRENEEKN